MWQSMQQCGSLPQFSIAPALKSGMAIISIFGNGNSTLNVFSKYFNTFGPISLAYSTCEIASGRAQIRKTTSLTFDSRYSKSLIEYATRYVDIGTVTSNVSSTQLSLLGL